MTGLLDFMLSVIGKSMTLLGHGIRGSYSGAIGEKTVGLQM